MNASFRSSSVGIQRAGLILVFLLAGCAASRPHQATRGGGEELSHRLGIARALAGDGRLDAAEQHFRAAISRHPNSVEAHVGLGSLLVGLGRAQEAEHLYRDLVGRGIANADLLHELGVALEALERPKEAMDAYIAALQCEPAYVPSLANVGNLLYSGGLPQEAERVYLRVLELEPRQADVHCNLGSLYRETGRTTEAVAAYQRAIELGVSHAKPHIGLGLIAREAGDLPAAAAAFRGAVERAPRDEELRIALIRTLEEQDDQAGVHEHLVALAVLRPADAAVQHLIGLSHCRGRRFQLGIPHFERAVQLDPNMSAAHRDWGFALMGLGRHHEALARYRQALILAPGDPMTHFQLGWCHVQLGDRASAERCLADLKRLDPELAKELEGKLWPAVLPGRTALGQFWNVRPLDILGPDCNYAGTGGNLPLV